MSQAQNIVNKLLEADPDDPKANVERYAHPEAYRFLLDDPTTPDEFIRAFYAGEDAEMSGDIGGPVPVLSEATGEWFESGYAKGFSTRGGKVNVMWEQYNENEEYEVVDEAEVGTPKEKLLDYKYTAYIPAQQRLEYAEASTGNTASYDPLGFYANTWPGKPFEQELAEARAEAKQTEAEYAKLEHECCGNPS